MKATGIVRRIDDLGRVVVPKEIRRTLHIREGDPMEIFTESDGAVILKKYSPIGELSSFAQAFCDSCARVTGFDVCVTDMDGVVAAAGPDKKKLMSCRVSRELERVLAERKSILASVKDAEFITALDGVEDYSSQAISPVMCAGDVLGAVVMQSKDSSYHYNLAEQQVVSMAADFIGRQMEL